MLFTTPPHSHPVTIQIQKVAWLPLRKLDSCKVPSDSAAAAAAAADPRRCDGAEGGFSTTTDDGGKGGNREEADTNGKTAAAAAAVTAAAATVVAPAAEGAIGHRPPPAFVGELDDGNDNDTKNGDDSEPPWSRGMAAPPADNGNGSDDDIVSVRIS